ncbi:hypothetical protein AB835_09120 [Candidatus Endobugula sertula]|uniref:Scaffold protein FimL second domain-containing protein n=1 Tax=Candidatus Endobugula sertula TaxID=62101 RepID=A0A1D2QP82_9GAMM|nr:hypothetical protein AB835_09120 [Candidatus Endobugula sertula]
MSNKQAVNLTSLNLIQGELMATIDTAATHLETFISEQYNNKVLEDCIESLQQIRGSLDLVQLHGACELAGEILTTATNIDVTNDAHLENKLAALTKGFFVLSCYFEYTQQHQVGMPILLIPYINDIRLTNGQPILPESYFVGNVASYRLPSSPVEYSPNEEEFFGNTRRYRHMYQVGLLGFLKELNVEKSLKMMHLAITKIVRLSKGSNSEIFWWLTSHAIEAFVLASMSLNMTRKRLFGQVDKCLKELEKKGVAAFDEEPSDALLKELVFYISIADIQQPEHQKIKQLFGFEHLGYTEEILRREAVYLTGPNVNTVQSVASVLRVELNVVKENIEKSQYSDDADVKGNNDSIARIQKAKDILHVVGLTSAADVLSTPLNNLRTCYNTGQRIDSDAAIELADAFLYVESVLNSLEKRNFSAEKLAEINRLTQDEMMSANHLETAQLVVIEQAETSFSAIKEALTAFADSGYDKIHLENICSHLDEIRGGMVILSLPRVAAIISACSEFIEQTLVAAEETAPLEQMLEAFADALICLEYYFDCMKVDKNVSADTLAIAEDSLSALGCNVSIAK